MTPLRYVVYAPATGEILKIVETNPVMGIHVGEDEAVIEGEANDALRYVVAGEVVERPSLSLPATGRAPFTLDMAALPDGTVVTATNELRETVSSTDPQDPIVLSDPGVFQVSLTPPFPWLPLTQMLEVTDA